MDIAPASWWSSRFIVRDGDAAASLDLAFWRDRGTVEIGDKGWQIRRDGLLGDFVLAPGAARAAKRAWTRHFDVEHAGKRYVLRPRSLVGRAFVLLEHGHEVGSVTPTSLWTRRATADLPGPLPFRLFIVWLVLMMWRRQHVPVPAGAAGS